MLRPMLRAPSSPRASPVAPPTRALPSSSPATVSLTTLVVTATLVTRSGDGVSAHAAAGHRSRRTAGRARPGRRAGDGSGSRPGIAPDGSRPSSRAPAGSAEVRTPHRSSGRCRAGPSPRRGRRTCIRTSRSEPAGSPEAVRCCSSRRSVGGRAQVSSGRRDPGHDIGQVAPQRRPPTRGCPATSRVLRANNWGQGFRARRSLHDVGRCCSLRGSRHVPAGSRSLRRTSSSAIAVRPGRTPVAHSVRAVFALGPTPPRSVVVVVLLHHLVDHDDLDPSLLEVAHVVGEVAAVSVIAGDLVEPVSLGNVAPLDDDMLVVLVELQVDLLAIRAGELCTVRRRTAHEGVGTPLGGYARRTLFAAENACATSPRRTCMVREGTRSDRDPAAW
jgi:hypothetical protein